MSFNAFIIVFHEEQKNDNNGKAGRVLQKGMFNIPQNRNEEDKITSTEPNEFIDGDIKHNVDENVEG